MHCSRCGSYRTLFLSNVKFSVIVNEFDFSVLAILQYIALSMLHLQNGIGSLLNSHIQYVGNTGLKVWLAFGFRSAVSNGGSI